MERRQRSASWATSSSGAFTNTPTSSSFRCSSAPIASASSTAQARGLPGQKIIPSAQAPSSATRRASAGSATPQIFTRVTPARLREIEWQPFVVLVRRLRRLRRLRLLLLLLLGRAQLLGPLGQLDLRRPLVVAAVELDLDLVAGLLAAHGVDHVLGAVDLLAVHRHDQIAPGGDAARRLVVSGAQARVVRRAPVLDALDQGAVVHR